LVSLVFRKSIVSFHPHLVLLGIICYPLCDGKQTLACLAVCAVERKGFVHGFLLSFHFYSDALLVELVLGNA